MDSNAMCQSLRHNKKSKDKAWWTVNELQDAGRCFSGRGLGCYQRGKMRGRHNRFDAEGVEAGVAHAAPPPAEDGIRSGTSGKMGTCG